MRVKVGGNAIPASFLKIEQRGTLVWAKDQREGRIEELVGGQNPGPEASPRSKKGQERREQKDVRTGAMEKGECVGVIDGEKVRRDDPVEYFLLAGIESTS